MIGAYDNLPPDTDSRYFPGGRPLAPVGPLVRAIPEEAGMDGEALRKRDPRARRCPLCDIAMEPGERVKSHVFPGKPDKMTHIFGCPSCYPPNPMHKRICPVCKKEVPREGYVIARMFDRPGRKHVHVLGCTGCRDRGLK